MSELTCLEVCAGAGGQSQGLESGGFAHLAAVEIDFDACETLRRNRPDWLVYEKDVRSFRAHDAHQYVDQVDLLAGGVPCPPFSIAGKQLGADDERDLFPVALDLVEDLAPRAVMLENVRGLATAKFQTYRDSILGRLEKLGYEASWQLLNASCYGVPQLRPRFILVALQPRDMSHFEWPKPIGTPPTVGETLRDMMAADGWELADEWAAQANSVAPTLVGGSRKHGGPDLGPTRARAAWRLLGVDGRTLAAQPPQPGEHLNLLTDPPRLTVAMTAALQGFDPAWTIFGRKTAAYRQVGNAFPPPVAEAVGAKIAQALTAANRQAVRHLQAV